MAGVEDILARAPDSTRDRIRKFLQIPEDLDVFLALLESRMSDPSARWQEYLGGSDGDHRAHLRRLHAGQWVAWKPDLSEIVAFADDPQEARRKGRETGISGLVYEHVPSLND